MPFAPFDCRFERRDVVAVVISEDEVAGERPTFPHDLRGSDVAAVDENLGAFSLEKRDGRAGQREFVVRVGEDADAQYLPRFIRLF